MALIFHSLKVEYSVEFSFLIGGKLAARFTSPNNNTLVVGKGVLTIEVIPFEVVLQIDSYSQQPTDKSTEPSTCSFKTTRGDKGGKEM